MFCEFSSEKNLRNPVNTSLLGAKTLCCSSMNLRRLRNFKPVFQTTVQGFVGHFSVRFSVVINRVRKTAFLSDFFTFGNQFPLMSKCVVLFLLVLPTMGFSQADCQKARQFFAQKKYAEAHREYLACFDADPKNKEAVERLGDLCAFSKKWKQAAQYYNKFVAIDPKNAEAHYKYGGALSMDASSSGKLKALGMIGDIRKSFETAISLNPKHIDARWALVEYYLQVPGIFGGSEAKANRYADELAKLSSVDHYLAKGRIEEYFGRYPKAEKYYLKAHAIGNSRTTLNKLTSVYAKMKRPDKAKAVTEAFESNTRTKTTSI